MKMILTIALAAILVAPHTSNSADRDKTQAKIDSARVALNDFKSKVGDNKTASADIEEAGRHIDNAAEAIKSGERFLGFGGISDESEQEVRHETGLSDLTLKRGASRLEQAKREAESAILAKKIDAVSAKVKIFDDFRAEIARLKGELIANEKSGKELDRLKGEKIFMETHLSRLLKEKEQLEGVKAENARLSQQLEKLQEELKKGQTELKVAAPHVK